MNFNTDMDKERAGYIEGIVSILINTVLFVLKLWAGIVSGSLALTADAWHTLADSLSSLIVLFSVKLSNKGPDKKHPFGHGRWEHIGAIFIGFLLGLVAYDFFKESLLHFKAHEVANFGTLAIVVTIISIVAKELLAQYAFYVAKHTGNLAVKADGWHHRTDAFSSVLVLIGILISGRFWWIDSALGLIISLMLFYASYEILMEAINKLLGEKPSKELIEKVKTIIRSSHQSEIYPHHFHLHNYVTSQELTFHIKVEESMDVKTAHEIATDIENKIYAQLDIQATVHIEPINFEHISD